MLNNMMNNLIKVLIVDDSYFIRSLIRAIIEGEGDMEVVGEAGNGQEAVSQAVKLKPNVITMDFNMPELNGEESTIRIIQSMKKPPAIIMFSAKTQEGADETLRCLKAGAFDFLAKPFGEVSINLDSVRDELLDKIRLAAKARIGKPDSETSQTQSRKFGNFRPNVVIIGSSTGGPPVVEYILSKMPSSLKMPILIVQHMPENFTGFFAERLNRIASLNVKEAGDGDVLEAGFCYVAPGDWHSEIRTEAGKKIVFLTKTEPYFGLRPSINRTMVSAAENFGDAVLGIILSGMGRDGVIGIEAIKNMGGVAFAQDPKTASIDSMPLSIISNGLADEVLTPEGVAARLIELNA